MLAAALAAVERTWFEEQSWILASGVPLPQDVGIVLPSATFEDGHAAGSTGCNRYTGTYAVAGDSLVLGAVASTLMACPPPADAVERGYLDALGRVARWRADGDALVLADAGGAEVLRYAPATPFGNWRVTRLLRGDAFGSALAGSELTASFGRDGRLHGSSGCNRFAGSYTTDAGRIEIGALAGTRKTCAEPAGVMEQEAAYLAALESARGFRADGLSLELLAADRTRLVALARA